MGKKAVVVFSAFLRYKVQMKIAIVLSSIITLFGSLALPVRSAEGIEGAINIYQTDPNNGANHLLFSDTNSFLIGTTTSGFLLTFSLDIEIKAADTSGCEFTVHLITLGPGANTYSRNFRVEYGLPARLSDIEGKNSTKYLFELVPLKKIEPDSVICEFDHHEEGTFNIQPSAHLDIHYVPNSLGDFYWTTVKGILEEHYNRIQDLYNFSLPGKYSVYLCPCLVPSVIWDKRFAMAVDPTRATAHALFTQEMNTADPFILSYTIVLRNYGYAPPFVSEGLANYLSLAIFDMKEIVDRGLALPLDTFLDTWQYYTADPYIADRTAATFVMYLVNEYGFNRFKQFYRAADDLNLRNVLEEQFGSSIEELEKNWMHFVDTSTIDGSALLYHAELAEAMFDYRLMLRYARAAVGKAQNHTDSLALLALLKRACFYNGDYYSATDVQYQLVQLESSSARQWKALGSYRMMNGLYDEAAKDLFTAFDLDSTDQSVRFNLAMLYIHRGEIDQARKQLEVVMENPSKGGPDLGSMIVLAELLRESDDKSDQALAEQYFIQAIRALEASLQTGGPAPTVHLWLGMSYLGLDKYKAAESYLKGALFLETRPFYLGMTHLYLGKLADLKGDREAAKEHYAQVLAISSATYHQRQARQYLETTYSR